MPRFRTLSIPDKEAIARSDSPDDERQASKTERERERERRRNVELYHADSSL